MSQWVFINEDFVSEEAAFLHVKDLSIQRGYGVFDFFKVTAGHAVFLDEHLERFYASATKMHLNIPYSQAELKTIIEKLLYKNQAVHCGVRLTLTGGYSPDGYQLSTPNLVISVHRFSFPSTGQYRRGIKLVSYEYRRQLPEVKTIDYLMAIWLQPMLRQQEADDVLYHAAGSISECPRANFFLLTKDNKLVTPARGVLKGITRNKVLQIAKNYFETEERAVALDEIREAKEAFITSTTKLILPVRQVDDICFPSAKPATDKLFSLFSQLQATSSKRLAQE